MKRWGLIASLLLLCTCVKANEPAAGSQTHFLASCEASCPEPYVCSCGVCTVSCTDDRTCNAQAPNATCSAGPSAEASCRVAPAVCDVECAANRDCAALGLGFSCRQGRCRAPQLGAVDAGAGPDAGAGADAGAAADVGVEAGATTDAASGNDSAASTDPICDGSDEMRLAVTVGGGFVNASFDFTNPYGHAFLFVDGQCRYFTSANYMQGIRSGTLSAAQASQLAGALGWSRLAAWSSLPGDGNCPDGGTISIRRAGAEASCSCGCDPGAPADKVAAFAQSDSWLQMLGEQGTPLTGSLSALALVTGDMPLQPNPLSWPLRPMTEIENLVHDTVIGATPARFDSADDTARLRELRAAELGRGTRGFIYVSSAGTFYELYVRDELPDGVAAAIDALLE